MELPAPVIARKWKIKFDSINLRGPSGPFFYFHPVLIQNYRFKIQNSWSLILKFTNY